MNQLTYLPIFNDKLQVIRCRGNQIKSLPNIHNVNFIDFGMNPIYKVLHKPSKYSNNQNNENQYDYIYYDSIIYNNIHILKEKINTLNQFRFTFYCYKFKNKLRQWLWVNIREPKIKEKYHPDKLFELLKNIDDNDQDDFDNILDQW